MTHSYAYKTKCIHTNRSITVWQSLFISIVCKFSYNTRSAAVLWPNKFNTTYAIGQYIHYTRTHKFIYIHFFLDDVGRFFLFSTHSLKSSIKSNSMSTAWSTDIQMKKFEWRKKNHNVNFIPFILHVINVVTTLSSSRFAFFVIKCLKIKSLNYYLCILYIFHRVKREGEREKYIHRKKHLVVVRFCWSARVSFDLDRSLGWELLQSQLCIHQNNAMCVYNI